MTFTDSDLRCACSWVLLRTELVAVQIIPHCASRFDDHLLAAVAELYHGERVSSKALAEVSTAGVTLAATNEREHQQHAWRRET